MLCLAAHAPPGGTAHARFPGRVACDPAGLAACGEAQPHMYSERRPARPRAHTRVPPNRTSLAADLQGRPNPSIAHGREQHNLTDGVHPGEEHHQPVDAKTDAAGGGHSLLQGFHEQLVVGL